MYTECPIDINHVIESNNRDGNLIQIKFRVKRT